MPTEFNERSFDSYDVRVRSSFAPFVRGLSSGIYIFEFANGQHYIGQTVNFAGRFNSHIRDSDHHEAWEDITRLMIMDAKPDELNELEFQIICGKKKKVTRYATTIDRAHSSSLPSSELDRSTSDDVSTDAIPVECEPELIQAPTRRFTGGLRIRGHLTNNFSKLE